VKYYPAYIYLKDKKAVVVGGGRVAERKVRLLINSGASVRIVSPVITSNIKKLVEKGLLEHTRRNYSHGDLNDAFIVIAATSDTTLNTRIAREARHLVNVIDVPTEGNYIVPSIMKRGPLTIAVSTEGASPAVSKVIRMEIEGLYGKDFALYLKLVERLRKKAIKNITNSKERERFLKTLASKAVFNSLRNKGYSATYKRILSTLDNLN
jgi:precorrin-2 dehydrogenase/sirohydrochlorin ferrochelatase